MVGRFVQEQHVGARQKQTAQRHTTLFTPRKVTNHSVPRRQTQSIRSNFHLRFNIRTGRSNNGFKTSLFSSQGIKVSIRFRVGVIYRIELFLRLHHFAHTFFDRLTNRHIRIERWFLRQVTDVDPRHRDGFPFDIRIDTRHDLKEGRLTRAI